MWKVFMQSNLSYGAHIYSIHSSKKTVAKKYETLYHTTLKYALGFQSQTENKKLLYHLQIYSPRAFVNLSLLSIYLRLRDHYKGPFAPNAMAKL